MSNYSKQVEVLSFHKDGTPANIVTDGDRIKTFEYHHTQNHQSLTKAIAYLEAKGYVIIPDIFNGL